MKLTDKIKSYSFWVSLASAIILILKILGTRFGFAIDEGMISDLFTALCSILVLLGIIVVPTATQNHSGKTIQNTQKTQQTQSHFQIEEIQNIPNKQNNPCNQITEDSQYKSVLDSHIYTNTAPCNNELEDSFENDQINFTEDNYSITKNNTEVDSLESHMIQNINLTQTENNSTTTNIQYNNNLTNDTELSISDNDKNIIQSETKQPSLKDVFDCQRGRFSNNLDAYIFELQEEIRRVREGN